MHENEISLGQCYLARLSKGEMPVRLERIDPAGGWIARSLTHGRVVRINDASQLIGLYDNNTARQIASEATPNRRTRPKETVKRPPTITVTEPYRQRRPAAKVIRPAPEPIRRKIILVRLSLLDAAHRILTEEHKPLTTREIVKLVTEKSYWTTDSPTPWATLHAALSRDIKAKGNDSRFAKGERGKFTLRK